MKSHLLTMTACVLSLAFFAGCGGDDTKPNTQTSNQNDNSALQHVILNEKPADIKTISAIKQASLKAGDPVTIQGRIGGKGKPFVESRAAFLLADDTVLNACDVTDDDHCPKPWDYCCEGQKKIRSNLATVQILGADKSIVKQSADGLAGIKPGSFVVVTGSISKDGGADNLIIDATGIFHDTARKIKKNSEHKQDHDHAH